MTDMPTVYLAGPIRKHPDGGKMWRDTIIDQYGRYFDFRNPLDRYDVPNDDLTVIDEEPPKNDDSIISVDQIVDGDKADIHASDGLFVGYFDVMSIGTPMEVMFAHDRDMPVVLCVMDETNPVDLSPWYRHHVDSIATTRDAALIDLEAMLDDEQWMWWS